MDLRLPRVLTAMLVGLALAVAGVTFQGLLRNPLADPYVLGTSSGAALGAAIAVLIPVRIAILELGLVQVFAFIGALLAIYTVYKLSRTTGLAPLTSLLLTGYAVGSLLAAGLAMAMYLSGAQLRQIFTYLLGSFDAASWTRLAWAVPIVAIATVAILLRARTLNGLLLGEETAANLGVNVARARHPARTRFAGNRRGRRDQRPDRVRRAGRAARRATGGRALGTLGPAALRDLRGRAHGLRGPGRAAPRRDPGRRRHRGDRRALLPADPAPRPGRVRAVSALPAVPAPIVRLVDVTVTYRSRDVLDRVDLAIEPGERVALVGPNGAGKSTLLRVAGGLLRPARGRAELGGIPVGALDRLEVAGGSRSSRSRPRSRLRRGSRRSSSWGGCRTSIPSAGRVPRTAPRSRQQSSASAWGISWGATCASCRSASASWC